MTAPDAEDIETVAFAIEMTLIDSAPYWTDEQRRAWWRKYADQDRARLAARAAISAMKRRTDASGDQPTNGNTPE
jgi:hypothetical protein